MQLTVIGVFEFTTTIRIIIINSLQLSIYNTLWYDKW